MQWPDNVKNSIFLYLWKIRIKDVNRQYSDKFKDNTDYNYRPIEYQIAYKCYDVSDRYDRVINYRWYERFFHNYNLITEQYTWLEIPKYYWFSSGINNPNGYK
jgi:hypothetical protein